MAGRGAESGGTGKGAKPAGAGAAKRSGKAARGGGRPPAKQAAGGGAKAPLEAPGRHPEQEVFTLTTLEQVKTLSDPLRIRILESLCVERTTKQVADLLGERPTKLYHHVDSLMRAGLIHLTRTRQNRGTVEKYYQSVARMFRTDPRLFAAAPGEGKSDALRKMLAAVFENTAVEMLQLLSSAEGADAIQEEGILSYLEVQASEKAILAMRAKMDKLIKEAAAETTSAGGKQERRRYRLTLAFFPLDRTPGAK